jgi:probable phosphoglycerate mutase
MRPLAEEAKALAPAGTVYTWVPRAENKHADRLVNEALDGVRHGVTLAEREDASLVAEVESVSAEVPARGWSRPGAATTLILLRHGVTPHTVEKRFSGGLASANPPLSDDGRAQVRAAAEWLAPLADRISAIVTSPVRRTRESAEVAAGVLGKQVHEEHGFAEMEFGDWDGLTFDEVASRHGSDLEAWLGSLDVAAGGGESFRDVQKRVFDGLQRVLDTHAGRTVVVVSHVTPIKTLVAHAVDAPLEAVFRMELQPASVSVVSFFPGGEDGAEPHASLRMFNALPPGNDVFSGAARW